MIRVLLADDHRLVRAGVSELLTKAGGIKVVAECGDGDSALLHARTNAPDVAVLDMSLPGIHGIDLVRAMTEQCPLARILVLSMHRDEDFVTAALRAGASGYLCKDSAPDVLVLSVRQIAAGERFVDPTLFGASTAPPLSLSGSAPALGSLSNREMQVLTRLVSGKTVGSIAAELHLSPKTVSTYKSRLQERLGVDSTADLVRYAIRNGLVRV